VHRYAEHRAEHPRGDETHPQPGERSRADTHRDAGEVADRDTGFAEDRLDGWCEQLAAYKYPRRVIFVDALPLGPSGKVLKRELVTQYKD
jgi:acyl-CoA synthetase (AMP-forming)/AMP-acid ligase II